MPKAPNYPIFDETGKLVTPGTQGGQFNPLKHANYLGGAEFNSGGRMMQQLKSNELIRYNIEKLGGLESTLDSKIWVK